MNELDMAKNGMINDSEVIADLKSLEKNKKEQIRATQTNLDLSKKLPKIDNTTIAQKTRPKTTEEAPEKVSPKEQELKNKMHKYFFETLFTESKPDEIDFESIDKYFQDIQIQDTISLGDNGNFNFAGIKGYLVRATINGKKYFMYTDSLDHKNKVKHLDITEMRLLLNTSGNHNDNIYATDINKLKETIDQKLGQIKNKDNWAQLADRLKQKRKK
ncbi:MAG: hypothetical protein COX80_04530 [Candidatus Magasanikbacteria bacterium CG_4_10_14_0_2_um_filter_33_14]|uniref:Uncharacterized protein n=1 Tax=Candidatus Magasanikbacteria bacterium CG_4_10_14_0_2_um_filter_33_14 TaxID=1974636 RepID=A0A2M7V976_9BACT|nr:MAG: hypothetical protein COX80_04530 [Candidatus Magasanikbacteria bacterium CG_4_10_14_0_2_um_filter_33_14]